MPPSSRAVVVLLGILTTILVGWVLHVGAGILQPLVIALLLASMLQPVVRWLARHHIPPPVTVILIVTLLFLGVARAGMLLQANVQKLFRQGGTPTEAPVEPTGASAGEGKEAAPLQDEPLVDPLSEEQRKLAERFNWDSLIQGFHDWMLQRNLPELFADFIHDSLRQVDVEGFAAGLIGGGLDFTKNLVLVVLYMLFIFAEQAVFRGKILSIFDERRDDARAVLDTIGRGIQRYLGVKMVTSFATGALCYSVLVWLDIPYAMLLGFVTFAFNFIPTFGSIIAGGLAAFVATVNEAMSNDPGIAAPIIVVITYLAVNMALGNYVEPKILGRELNLSPLVVIISVVVWAGVWGAVGTFLAVPLTAALQIILASNENTRPIAVMLSSGPPRESRRRRQRREVA